MKSMKVLLFLTMLLITISFTFSDEGESLSSTTTTNEMNSLRGTNNILGHLPIRVVMTNNCQKNPSVCLVEGSPGPDCCTKKCVNLMTDSSNCGRCGKKCGYRKMCCDGKCVNPMSNEQHCGKCGNKCDNRSSCTFGMCSYA